MAADIKASVSGIRGIVGESFTPPLVLRSTAAYARWLGKGRVAIGRDTRVSGFAIQNLAASALLACGIDVVDIGIVPTPTLLLFVRRHALDGGIMISASHNPIEWNALKLVKRGGLFLNQEDFAAFQEFWREDAPEGVYKPARLFGNLACDEAAAAEHIDAIANTLSLETLRSRRFRVAADPGNGAGARMDTPFLTRLGCDVFQIHGEITGDFARPPEPRPDALGALSELVTRERCDVGFAQDPDADRLCVVDEKGRALSEEMTLALSAWAYYLSRERSSACEKGDIVVNVSTSRYAADIARHYGRQCHLSRVGEANVLALMMEKNAGFGGEGNGGVIYPLINPCRDSFVGISLILDLMAALRMPLSEIIEKFHKEIATPCTMIKEKCAFTGDMSLVSARIREDFRKFGEGCTENTMDGLRLDFADAWVHLRESNTEPVVRVIAEARDAARARDLVRIVKAALV